MLAWLATTHAGRVCMHRGPAGPRGVQGCCFLHSLLLLLACFAALQPTANSLVHTWLLKHAGLGVSALK